MGQGNTTGQTAELKWYATKTFIERAYVLKYLEQRHVETARIADIPSILFIHCTLKDIRWFRYELFGKLYVYRAAENTDPAPISDQEMNTFLLLAPFHSQPVIYLAVDDPAFFEGRQKRVNDGPFKGCVGIIKRLKGCRRLIVKISDHAAIATPYIPAEYLEDLPED